MNLLYRIARIIDEDIIAPIREDIIEPVKQDIFGIYPKPKSKRPTRRSKKP